MNTLTDNNADCNEENSVESPPQRRRRSSFFERRSIVVGNSVVLPTPLWDYGREVREPTMDIEDNDSQDDNRDDEHLNQYYAQLLSEKEQWKKEVQNRRGILHDAEMQLNMAKKSDKIRINYSILSNEDIEFVRGKPNLTDLVKNVNMLQKSTMVTYALFKRMCELDDVILDDAEDKVQRITSNLLENSAGIPD